MNIMNGYKYIILLLPMILILSCGDRQTGDTRTETEDATVELNPQQQIPREEMTEEQRLKADLTNMMDRLAEGDKTALYENEFSYYRIETPLSEYWKQEGVYAYKYDTLRGIEFDSVKIMGDSARVWARIIYDSKAGTGRIERNQEFWMYNYTGDHWIKPYLSYTGSMQEKEYLENLRRYQEDAGE